MTNTTSAIHVIDHAPRRIRDYSDIVKALIALLSGVVTLLCSLYFRSTTIGVQTDAHKAARVVDWIFDLPATFLQQSTMFVVLIVVLASLALRRRWIELISCVIAMFLSIGATCAISLALSSTITSYLLTTLLAAGTSLGINLLPNVYAGMAALLTVAGRRRTHSSIVWGWNIVIVCAVLLTATSWHTIAGCIVSICIGRIIGLIIRLIIGNQSESLWGDHLAAALESIGLHLTHLERYYPCRETLLTDATLSHAANCVKSNTHSITFDEADGNSGGAEESEAPLTILKTSQQAPLQQSPSHDHQPTLDDDLTTNTRLYRATDDHSRHFIVSVSDNHTHMVGYLGQLWRWIRLNDVPTRRDRSASSMNHHHMNMILGLQHIGLPTCDVYGVVDHDESSVLVWQSEPEATVVPLEHITSDDMLQLMHYLDAAHQRGFTHRQITPQCLAVKSTSTASPPLGEQTQTVQQDSALTSQTTLQSNNAPSANTTTNNAASGNATGAPATSQHTVMICGWHNGDSASSSINMLIDRVQLLTIGALSLGVERTVALARDVWSDSALSELIPFLQKVVIPRETKRVSQWNPTILATLSSALQALSTDENEQAADNVTLSRFSLRSFLALALTVVAVLVILTQLKPTEMIDALEQANMPMAIFAISMSFVAWLGSAISLGAFIEPDKRQLLSLYCSQVAAGFTSVSMPAGVGPAFVNLQYLRRIGYPNTKASALMTATLVVQVVTTAFLLITIGLFTGRNTLSGMLPSNILLIVVGIIVLLCGVAMVIIPVRRFVIERILPLLRSYTRKLIDILSQPREITVSILGSLLLNIATGLGFWFSLLAFGYSTNPIETVFIFLLANTLGSAVPTPGGLGAVEAALTFAFTSVGVPGAIALSATIMYRLSFYWLRIPCGALAMKWLNHKGLV